MTNDPRASIYDAFFRLKHAPAAELEGHCLAFQFPGTVRSRLRPLTQDSVADGEEIARLARWRDACQYAFPAQFKVTLEGTRNWLQKAVVDTQDRLLLVVETDLGDGQWKAVGHVGLFRVAPSGQACEIDNIVRGEPGLPGLIEAAIWRMLDWVFESFGHDASYLRVFSDNPRAIHLYERMGYVEIQRVPLKKVEDATSVRWVEIHEEPYLETSRYFVTMKLPRETWRRTRNRN